MPMSRPTMAFVERVMMLLGMTWLGPWQYQAMDHLIRYRRRTLKMPRQTGKSECVGLWACCLLLMGFVVTVLMPTYTQAQRILFRDKISAKMRKLEHIMGLKRIVDTTTEVVWANGAALRALSINESSQKEGYTTDEMIVDEGHNAYRQLLDVASPFITQAKRRGTDGICVLGVGGMLDTLIECLSADGLYEPLWITPQYVMAADPSYVDVFEEYRRTMTPEGYSQMVECKPVTGGNNLIFGTLPERVESKTEQIFRKRNLFGIDVGRVNDQTVVSVIENSNEVVNVIAELRIGGAPFPEQARRICTFIDKYIYRPQDVAIEINGLGVGLYDELNSPKRLYGLRPIGMNYDLKKTNIDTLRKLNREGRLGVEPVEMRNELAVLTLEVKENYKFEFTHSDRLSSIVVGICAGQEVMAA